MTTKSAAAALALMLAPLFVPAAMNRVAADWRPPHCQKTVFCMPKNPCIRYKCICPKKICPDCPIENFGYFPTCWQPWPFPPNYYCHCPVQPITLNAPQSTLDTPPAPAKAQELPPPKPVEPDTTPNEKPANDKAPTEPKLP